MDKTLLVLLLNNGTSPVEEWLGKIRDITTRVKIAFQIDKLSRSLGFTKNVGGISELKIDIGPGYRVYYAALGLDTYVVLIGAGSKKTQSKDIRSALALWEDFVSQGQPDDALREWQFEMLSDDTPEEPNETEKL